MCFQSRDGGGRDGNRSSARRVPSSPGVYRNGDATASPPPPQRASEEALAAVTKSIPASLQRRIVKTKICVHNLRGRCTRAERCSFAHSVAELREQPDLSKTRLCINFSSTGTCLKGASCRFAHGESELRWTPEFYKTSLCQYWKNNISGCSVGQNCRWAHGLNELRRRLPGTQTRYSVYEGEFDSRLHGADTLDPYGEFHDEDNHDAAALPVEFTTLHTKFARQNHPHVCQQGRGNDACSPPSRPYCYHCNTTNDNNRRSTTLETWSYPRLGLGDGETATTAPDAPRSPRVFATARYSIHEPPVSYPVRLDTQDLDDIIKAWKLERDATCSLATTTAAASSSVTASGMSSCAIGRDGTTPIATHRGDHCNDTSSACCYETSPFLTTTSTTGVPCGKPPMKSFVAGSSASAPRVSVAPRSGSLAMVATSTTTPPPSSSSCEEIHCVLERELEQQQQALEEEERRVSLRLAALVQQKRILQEVAAAAAATQGRGGGSAAAADGRASSAVVLSDVTTTDTHHDGGDHGRNTTALLSSLHPLPHQGIVPSAAASCGLLEHQAVMPAATAVGTLPPSSQLTSVLGQTDENNNSNNNNNNNGSARHASCSTFFHRPTQTDFLFSSSPSAGSGVQVLSHCSPTTSATAEPSLASSCAVCSPEQQRQQQLAATAVLATGCPETPDAFFRRVCPTDEWTTLSGGSAVCSSESIQSSTTIAAHDDHPLSVGLSVQQKNVAPVLPSDWTSQDDHNVQQLLRSILSE